MVKALAMLFALFMVGRVPESVHPLHSSFTEATRDRATGTVSISVRLFADDFGAQLVSLRAEPASRSLSIESVAQRYVQRALGLSSGNDGAVELAWCGMRTEDGLTWVCLRSTARVPPGKLRLRNALMFDRFSDQINIVRWMSTAGARTIVLTARAPEAALD